MKIKLKHFLLWVACIVTSLSYGQEIKTIRGIVKNKENTPVENTSVVVLNTNRATITNSEGLFSINARVGETLEASGIGYRPTQVKIGSSDFISIILSDTVGNLNEVVVIGYGTTTRKNLTTAQQTIRAADIEHTVNTTFDQALQGRAAGVVVTSNSGQPGGSISVKIRGVSTIMGNQEPLYIVDGIQIQPETPGFGSTSSSNPLASLNPNDIEAMEILQGPSATAIYGSRATNGVILITTKRGKAGKTKITYDFLYSMQDKPDLIPMLNLKEWAIVSNELRRAYGQPIPSEYQDSSVLGAGTNWQDVIFRRAPLQKHQVSLSGGNENTRFYFSGEHLNQTGIAFGSEFKRTSVRLNLDNNVTKWLKIGVNLAASQTNEQLGTSENDVIKLATQIPPYIPVKNPDGSWGGYPEGLQPELSLQNPLALASLISNSQQRRQLQGGINVSINLLKGLELKTNLTSSVDAGKIINFVPTYVLGARSNTQATLSKSYSDGFFWLWNQILDYKTAINDHNIGIMAGHEAQEPRWEGISGARSVFPVNQLPGGFVPVLSMGNEQGSSNGDYRGWNSLESYFGRASYDYKNKYFAIFNFRRDGSTNFGANNRWGNFPSGSLAWRAIEEPFMSNQSFFSELKFRFETGLTGNTGLGQGLYAPLRPVASGLGTGWLTTMFDNPDLKWESTMTYNYGINIGILKNRITLDADYYVRKTNNLISTLGAADFYGVNQEFYGIGAPFVNIGSLENKGFTLTINTVNVNRPGLKWTTNLNLSHNKTKVLSFFNANYFYEFTNWNAGGFSQRSVVGQAPWQFYGYIYDGIFKTLEEVNSSAVPDDGTGHRIKTALDGVWVGDVKYKDLNADGLINEQDKTFIGSPYPKLTFGMTNALTWKNLDFMVLLTGSYGNKIYNAMRFSHLDIGRTYGGGTNLFKEAMNYARVNGETLLNPDAVFPRFPNGSNGNWNRPTDFYVEDGSYLRVKNITVSYRIPENIVSKAKFITGVKLGLGIQNVYTFTKYKGFDPEVGADVGKNSDDSRRTFGVDVGQYPQSRMYHFNVGINF